MKRAPLEEKDMLNFDEATTLYGMSRRKFRRLLESEGLPFVANYGNRKLILRQEFEAYLRSRPEMEEGLRNKPRKKDMKGG